MVTVELTPNLPQFRLSGRWTQTDSGSLIASWASASVSFILTSSSLSIRLGPQTTHKDTFDGSSTTLVCSLSDLTGSHDYHLPIPTSTQVLTFPDADPGLLSLFDRLKDGQQKLIKITLVDWSSVLELVSIVVDSVRTFPLSPRGLLRAEAERHSHQSDAVQALPKSSPGPRLLFIGDSISCGYASPQMLIPHGSLDAFTSRASEHLGVPYGIIAYPGVTLVGPTASGVSFVHREPGMVSRFFLVRAERTYAASSISHSSCVRS
jgi:hypothetical protein